MASAGKLGQREGGLVGFWANERAVGPVLKLLKDTDVGDRAGKRERELEWQTMSDQEGEDKLTD